MIDICIPVFRNYDILDLNIDHFKSWIRGDWRLLIVDTTPKVERKYHRWLDNPRTKFYELEILGDDHANYYDGVSHGTAINFLVRQTDPSSVYIGTQDSDFFWLDPTIVEFMQSESNIEKNTNFQTVTAFGAGLWYGDWCSLGDARWPGRAGFLAPAVYGQFIHRSFVWNKDFRCTPEEGAEIRETGWRIREALIENKEPCVSLPGFYLPEYNEFETCFFGGKNAPSAVHFLKGSFGRSLDYGKIKDVLEFGKAQWGEK
jgi:hypothetical protein